MALPGAGIHGGEVTAGRFQRGAITAARHHHTAIAALGACGIRQVHQATLWHPAAPHLPPARSSAQPSSGAGAGPGQNPLAGPGGPAIITCLASAGL